jgi:hypothetical protein
MKKPIKLGLIGMALIIVGCFDFVAFKSTLGKALMMGGVLVEMVAIFSFISQKMAATK